MKLVKKDITYGTDFLKLKVVEPFLTEERLSKLSQYTCMPYFNYQGKIIDLGGLSFCLLPVGDKRNMCNIFYIKNDIEISVGSYILPIHRMRTQHNKNNFTPSVADYERLELTGTFFEEFGATYSEYHPILTKLLDFFGVKRYELGRFDIRMDIVNATPEGLFKCYEGGLKEKSVFYGDNKYKETIYLASEGVSKGKKKIRIYDKKIDIIKKDKHLTSDYCSSLLEIPGNITRVEIEFPRQSIRINKREHSIEEMEAYAMHLIKYEFGIESGRVYRERKTDREVHSELYIKKKIAWTTIGAMRNEDAAFKYLDLYYKMTPDNNEDTFRELVRDLIKRYSMCKYEWLTYVQKFNPHKNKHLYHYLN